MAASANPARRALEWKALCILCAHFGGESGVLQTQLNAVNESHFLDPVHRALFREIAQCRRRGASREELRQRLPEQMTRLGWPDLDFDALFCAEPSDFTAEESAELLRQLRGLAANGQA